MKQLARLTTALALTLLAVPALAAAQPGYFDGHHNGPKEPYAFRGEVHSVDPSAGTIDARLEHLNPRDGRTSEPFAGTIRTDADTHVVLNAEQATVADLEPGDELTTVIVAEPGLTPEAALAQPAWVVAAHRLPAIHGFAGSVRGVDREAGTLTLAVRYATWSGPHVQVEPRLLTFRIDGQTEIVRNGQRTELAELEAGDLAGVAIVTRRGASLEEVLATPARAVIAASRRYARRHGMRRGPATLGGRAVRFARR